MNEKELTAVNGMGFQPSVLQERQENVMQASHEAKATAEVQAAYVIAKRYPRDLNQAFVNIMDSCKRPFLAEQAFYNFPRGGTLVSGASIRLAEILSQCFGNMDFGIKELSQSNGVSLAEAYAIDLQTNTRSTKIFHVKHERHTKKGVTKLNDPRDIYEMVANNGSRRLRACILAIIPGDIVEAAVEQCKRTLESSDVPVTEQIRKMVVAFDEMGIKVEHLEKRLGHNLDATIPSEIVKLKGIYKSLKDGMADRSDYFEIGLKGIDQDAQNQVQALIEEKTKNSKKRPLIDEERQQE